MKFTPLHWGPLIPRMFLGLAFSWWRLRTGAAAVLLYRAWPWQRQCQEVCQPCRAACPPGDTGMWGCHSEPETLTCANCTGRSHLCNAGEEGKKGFFLLLFSLFSSQISLSLCFLGVTCALPHKEYCTRKRLVYSRESVKCFKEEFSSKKRWVLTKKEGTS